MLTQKAQLRARAGDTAGEVALLVRAAEIWERRLESPESATDILERILERDPKNVRALLSLANIYEGARDLEKSKATLERANLEIVLPQREALRDRARPFTRHRTPEDLLVIVRHVREHRRRHAALAIREARRQRPSCALAIEHDDIPMLGQLATEQ